MQRQTKTNVIFGHTNNTQLLKYLSTIFFLTSQNTLSSLFLTTSLFSFLSYCRILFLLLTFVFLLILKSNFYFLALDYLLLPTFDILFFEIDYNLNNRIVTLSLFDFFCFYGIELLMKNGVMGGLISQFSIPIRKQTLKHRIAINLINTRNKSTATYDFLLLITFLWIQKLLLTPNLLLTFFTKISFFDTFLQLS